MEHIYGVFPAARPAPKSNAPFAFNAEDVANAALTVHSDPESQRETGNRLAYAQMKRCMGLSHVPRDVPLPAQFVVEACVCTTLPGRGGGGEKEGGSLTVEVRENFSEGIHCPLAERTA